jgi:hypothetical protein
MNPQGEDDSLKMPISEGDIAMTVLISGLRKASEIESPKLYSAKVTLGSNTRVDELILALMAKGKR